MVRVCGLEWREVWDSAASEAAERGFEFLWVEVGACMLEKVATQNRSLKTMVMLRLKSWISMRSCRVSLRMSPSFFCSMVSIFSSLIDELICWSSASMRLPIRDCDLSPAVRVVTSPWNFIWLSRRCLAPAPVASFGC